MKNLFHTILFLLLATAASAQTKVVDSAGEPLIGTVAMDLRGTPVAIADKDGMLPRIGRESYPITLRCMGFENAVVDRPADRVTMTETAYSLTEVVVRPGERPACHVLCYVRETSGMMNDTDTMRLNSQYMVDYMLRDDPKAKGFSTWDSPRLLASDVQQYSASGRKMDSADVNLLTWYNIVSWLSAKNAPFPKELHQQTGGRYAEKSKKYDSDMVVCHLSPSQYSVFKDNLADSKDHKWSPAILKLFGATIDVNEYWTNSTYNFAPDEVYNLRNLVAKTVSLKILGRGKLFHTIFGGKSPVEINSYIEIFPVAIEYLTREEAKEVKRDKHPDGPFTIPEAARK